MSRLSSSRLTRPLRDARDARDARAGRTTPVGGRLRAGSAVEEERAGPDLVPVGLVGVEVDGAVAGRGLDGQLTGEGQRQVGGSGDTLDRDVEAGAAEVAADWAGVEVGAGDREA